MILNRPIHGGNLAWAALQAGCPASLIVDFSASINPLGPPSGAIAAIQTGIHTLSAYPDPNYSQLRTALAHAHGRSPEWILPGNGAAELLTWAGRELAQCGVTHLITPAFSDYWRALTAFGATVHPYPLDLNTGTWMEPTSTPHAGLLLNNPHNPTGRLFSRASILPLLEKFDLVVVDEAFMDFLAPSEEQSLIPLVEDHPNLVIVRSLTKFYSLPGLRLGYAVAHPERLQRWQSWRDPWSINTLAAAVGEAVIADREFQAQTWRWLPTARAALSQNLASLPGLQPLKSSANFLLVRTDYPSSQLQARLLKNHRLLIRDCLSFPELGERYFRVAVRSPQENERLYQALADTILTLTQN